jgi:hypothetical protein
MAFGSPDNSVINPKVYAVNFIFTYNILWYPDKFCIRDKVSWAAGRRAAGSVFCSPFIKFTMTSNFAPFTRTLTQSAFILTRGFALIYQDWQKTRQPRPGLSLIKPAAVSCKAILYNKTRSPAIKYPFATPPGNCLIRAKHFSPDTGLHKDIFLYL